MLTPHRRFNPLTREWVLVSPQRTARPWQGQVESTDSAHAPAYDPDCYLCPRNTRAGGVRNPDYDSTFVFDNDFAALKPDSPVERTETDGLLIAESEPGICRVVCFSPRHDLTLSNMDPVAIRKVVDTWVAQFEDLGWRPNINYVQIFENRGAMMGASNPHPHGQIWASRSLPNEIVKEQSSLAAWRSERGSCMLCEYERLERAARERIVEENEGFLAIVPYWAVWPFETMLVSRRHLSGIDQLSGEERTDLADMLKQLTARYDRLFQISFPYTMGFHQRPTDHQPHDEWHLHLHFYPPLLRSATVMKFMVGYEMLATPQRDITAESAAERLRTV
jgi:UDPglucose--hexose-1-phosphate uridylyltransferase